MNEMVLMVKRSGKNVSDLGVGTVDERVKAFHTEFSRDGSWPTLTLTGYDAKRGSRILWSTHEHSRAVSIDGLGRLGIGAAAKKLRPPQVHATLIRPTARFGPLEGHTSGGLRVLTVRIAHWG